MSLWDEIKALGKGELIPQQEARLSDLLGQQTKRGDSLRPRVQCCKAGAEGLEARLHRPYDSNHYPTHEAPYWAVGVRGEHEYEPRRVRFCPWCAAEVPGLVKQPDPAEHYTCYSDGGYYCDECSERLQGCFCLPAVCAWKVRTS